MRSKLSFAAAAMCLLSAAGANAQIPLTTAFTYQGELASAGTPATGTYDIRFRLFDAASGGNQIGSTLCSDNLAVSAGRFGASLDFGGVFTGQKRFLEIEVRQDAGLDCSDASGYTVLTPRQELTAAPNATFALTATNASSAATLGGQPAAYFSNAANLTGTVPSAGLAGPYANALTLSNPANLFAGNGVAITNLSATNIATGTLDAARMPTNWAAGGDLGGLFPSPTINAGAVTLSKLAPGLQGVLSTLTGLTPAPIALDAVAWGVGGTGQLNIPALPTGVTYTAVEGGSNFSVALRSDGTVVGWGANGNGQLNVPALPAGVTYTAVAGGDTHSIALRSDGNVIAWGNNTYGQTNVPALPQGVRYTAIAAGSFHNVARRSDDSVIAWGLNSVGQCNIPELPVGITCTALAAGNLHTVALLSDGGVYVWGYNAYDIWNIPVLPAGVRYTAVAAGGTHSLALRSDGAVVAWGRDNFGQTTVPVLPQGVTYAAVAAGDNHSLALRSDGTVVAWGNSASDRLAVPVLPPGVIYTAVAAGGAHSLAIRSVQVPPSLSSTVGLSIGSTTPPPANGGIRVAGASSFAAGVSAASFTGSGAGLTNINATQLNGQPASFYANATNLTTGTLADGLLSSNIPRLNVNNTFAGDTTFANKIRVNNGVITDGATNAVATADLGLYSQRPGFFLRFVTSGGGFVWYTDGATTPAGGAARMQLTSAGNLSVVGSLAKAGGSFKIDHPLDPENKYLYHSFVESPDMMNIYNGNVATDASGYATITLPDYFEALNRDFRYQLTVIDENDDMEVFLWAKVVREVKDNQFTLRSSRGNLKVSWQVTGIRQDAWANTNRIPNSVDKPAAEKGTLLHPEALGKPAAQGIAPLPAPATTAATSPVP